MPDSSRDEEQLITLSFEELKYIRSWVRKREENNKFPITVLIGGWAVDAYNSWYGSVDVDLVTNHETREDLKWHLLNYRGFEHYGRELGAQSVAKETPFGKIIMDISSRARDDPFEGRKEALNSSIFDGNTEIKMIRGVVSAAVPTRSLLLLLKLKAAWDRTYRVESGTSYAVTMERGKIIKDYADILALIDPEYGGEELNIAFLGEQFTQFDFLKKCVEQLPDNYDAVIRYRKMDREAAREVCDKLLLLMLK